jgi:hypothetical protein
VYKKNTSRTLCGAGKPSRLLPEKPLRGNGLTHHVNHHFPKRLLLLFRQVDKDITVRVLGATTVFHWRIQIITENMASDRQAWHSKVG